MDQFEITANHQTTSIQIDPDKHEFITGGESREYSLKQQASGRRLLRVGRHLYKIDDVNIQPQQIEFSINGRWFSVKVRDERDILLDEMGFKTASEIGEGRLNAPMPGKIIELMVDDGDEVERGDPVAILEAMKMENELKAPIAGSVSSIDVSEGDSLEKNAPILEITARG
jgi:pyruvate carboxylase subunit B